MGHDASVPDLTPMVESDEPAATYRALADATVTSVGSPVIIVGHSGAGAFLPSVSRQGDAHALLFLDAVLPPLVGVHRTPDALRDKLEEHAVAGVLRPWVDWWPPGVMADLIPDPNDAQEIAVDVPRVPLSFYDWEVPVPDGWSSQACGYLRCSGAYDPELAEARRRGWPTGALDSTHLGVFTEPDRVFEALLELVPE